MDILNDVLGYSLDDEQKNVVLDESENILVIAGAGSGKTLTIVGKIRYLIEEKKYKESEILVLSFTKETVNSLKNKLKNYYNYDIEIYTFHKLSFDIIRSKNRNIEVAPDNFLNDLIDEYFNNIILEYDDYMFDILKYFKVKNINNILKNYRDFIENNYDKINNLKIIICKFICLFKEKGYSYNNFIDFLNQNKSSLRFNKTKHRLFFKITLIIYQIYQKELKNMNWIDFSDMLLNAIDILKNNEVNLKYKYIIIDEYQDSSYLRFSLINSIKDITNAKILAVGDDFQSIYRFTGCNLDMFLNFNKMLPNSKILKITNTYRNSQELIDIAAEFIMKNPYQIKKDLKSFKRLDNPIRLITTDNQSKSVKEILDSIDNKDILILGRNNFDIKKILDDDFIYENNNLIYKKRNDLNIRYLTVHKSKGLESDIVILINVNNELYGFPSKLKNEEVLRYVLDNKDYYKYEEERRLFYVAITRTKSITYIISEKGKVSRFVKEIKRYI